VKRSIADGTIGQPVSALVSRHITRNLGKKIGGRVKLSPAAMEATHDIDFVLWCLAPRKPVRVYAQEVRKIMGAQYNVPDCVWIVVTMDDGVVFTIGAGWVLPPAYPNFSSTWIEFVGTEGAAMVDDTHRDVYVTTMQNGIQFPLSSMPGEKVDHVYAGPMQSETLHFLECVALGKQPLVTAEQARLVMQVYQAADLSAETIFRWISPARICVPPSRRSFNRMPEKAEARFLTRQQHTRRRLEVVPARRSKTTQSCPRDHHRLGNFPVVVHWRTSTRRRRDGWRAVQNLVLFSHA
jgi:hypothetical protein